MATSSPIDKALLFKLLKSSTSIPVVSDFLKKKNLPHSAGSWDDMFSLRLEPGLGDSTIQIDEIVDLLRTVEGYGRQHVFLYKTSPTNAQFLIDRGRVGSALTSLNLLPLLTSPNLYEYPALPTISDVCWVSTDTHDIELVIKEIQSREFYKLSHVQHNGNELLKTYTKVQERGVNVARLHRNGNLEVRVASRSGSLRYGDDLKSFRARIQELLPMTGFIEISLRKAKDTLWDRRTLYDGKIRFSEVAARNDDDFILKAAGGNLQANISANEASVSSLENFLGMDGKCESFNLWFAKEHTPSKRDVHFLLSGDVNEFAINASCTQDDYTYVLSELQTLNT